MLLLFLIFMGYKNLVLTQFEVKNVTIETIGNINIKADLESLINVDDYDCDEKSPLVLSPQERKCEWVLHYNLCIFQQELTEKEITEVYSKKLDFPTVYHQVFPTFLNCTESRWNMFDINVNSINYPYPLVDYDSRSKRIMRFAFNFYDYDDYPLPYRNNQRLQIFFRDMVYKRYPNDDTFIWTTQGKDFFVNKPFLTTFKLHMKCVPLNYGFDCWYTCGKNSICSCRPNIQSIADACTISCKIGYQERFIRYILPYSVDLIKNCDIKDTCYFARLNNQCNSTFQCFSLNNDSLLCGTPSFNLTNQKEQKYPLVTTDKFEVFKTLFFQAEQFKLDMIVPDKLKMVGSVVMKVKGDPKFVKSTFLNHYMAVTTQFDIQSTIEMNMTFVDWVGSPVAKRTLIFAIHLKPVNIQFFDNKTNMAITYNVGINQTLRMNVSVAPLYRTIIYWECKLCMPNIDVFDQVFTVLINIDIFSSKLTCYVALISYFRGIFRISKSIYITRTGVYIEKFGWNNYSSFIDYKTPISCIVRTISMIRIDIAQIDGNSWVKIKKNDVKPEQTLELVLNEITGGQYVFVCILFSVGKIFRSSTLEFIVRALPTFVCLFFFPHTRGELVQCAHDGYAPKEFLVMMSYYDKIDGQFVYQYESNKESNVDANAYIRIHYREVESNEFRIVCNVTSLHYNQSKVYEYISVLNNKVTNQYILTKNNQQCLGTGPDLDPPYYLSIHDNVVEVKQFVFYLPTFLSTIHQSIWVTMAVLSLFSLMFMFLFIFICVWLRVRVCRWTKRQQKSHIRFYRLLLISQTAHTQLEDIATNLICPNILELHGIQFTLMMTSDEVDLYNTNLLRKELTEDSL